MSFIMKTCETKCFICAVKNFLFVLCLCSSVSYGQEKMDKIWLSWGYNRSAYTKSDLHFEGENYDFELHKVKATDRPTPVSSVYIDPNTITIPQYCYRIGFNFSDSLMISVGIDHLKYVMVEGQEVRISGVIEESASTRYSGTYDNDPIVIDPDDLLQFEHSDGLNYIDVELSALNNLTTWGKGHRVDLYYGGGVGIYLPKTRVNLFDNLVDNKFHVAGPGVSLHSALRSTFWNTVFIETQAKAGYAYLPVVLVLGSEGKADHQFAWGMIQCSIGLSF